MKRTFLLAALVLSLPLAQGVARACSPIPPPEAHATDASLAATDTAPPSVPVLREVTLVQDLNDSPPNDSCGDLSSLRITLTGAATDDRSSADRIGYRIAVSDGALPSGLTLPAAAVRNDQLGAAGAGFVFVFGESNADVRFSLRVHAVDEAGNESAASNAITVVGERELLGCSAAGGAPDASSLLGAVLVLCALAMRRRSSVVVR